MDTSVEQSNASSNSHSSAEIDSTPLVPPAEEPLIVARFFRVDENGQRQEFVRTRGGREIRVLRGQDAADLFDKYPYEE